MKQIVFFFQNHLLGSARGKFSYGLFLRGELVAAALFGRSVPIQRNNETYISYELIRFCNLRNYYVQGGLTKLIAHFIRQEQPEDIYTSIDRDWSNGKGFLRNGFKLLGSTPPLSFWVDQNGERRNTDPGNAIHIVNSGNLRMALNPSRL